jgi:hypothetical protein
MHLFSPDRPESSPGCPALLREGSAAPYFSVRPKANGHIGLSVLLRDYGKLAAAFSYSYHHIDLPPENVSNFFAAYAADPEATLLEFFGWEAKQTTTAGARRPAPPAETAPAPGEAQSLAAGGLAADESIL